MCAWLPPVCLFVYLFARLPGCLCSQVVLDGVGLRGEQAPLEAEAMPRSCGDYAKAMSRDCISQDLGIVSHRDICQDYAEVLARLGEGRVSMLKVAVPCWSTAQQLNMSPRAQWEAAV